MRQRSRTCRWLCRRPAPLSTEDTRRQLALMIAALFGLCCVAALYAPDSPMLDRLLPFLGQQLALVIGYYFGRRGAITRQRRHWRQCPPANCGP